MNLTRKKKGKIEQTIKRVKKAWKCDTGKCREGVT
jgi:hypothetical protein